MQGMKEWKNVIFLVIFYGSCCSNNIIVRKIQAVVNWVMKPGAPQNVGNFFTSWGIISSQEGVTIVVILVKCKAPPWKFQTSWWPYAWEFYRPTTRFFCFTGLCCGFTKMLQESSGTTLHHHQATLAVSFEAGSMPNVYTLHTFWQGSTNIPDIWQLPPNSRCKKHDMKQDPYQAPTTLEWQVTLTVYWRFPSCMWTKCIFVYKGQNCNNYAEDIGCHHTKLSCLPLTGCLGCVNPCIPVWIVKDLTTLSMFYNT